MTRLYTEVEEKEYLQEYYHPYSLGDVLDLDEIDLIEFKEAEEEAFITSLMDEQAEQYEREAQAQIKQLEEGER